jgi:hypothetical protein
MTPNEIYNSIGFIDPDEFSRSQITKNLFSIDILSKEQYLYRRTGRTTARIVEAISIAMSGKNVLYIIDNEPMKKISFIYATNIISFIKNKSKVTLNIDFNYIASCIYFLNFSNSRIKFSTKLEEIFTKFDATKNNFIIKDINND